MSRSSHGASHWMILALISAMLFGAATPASKALLSSLTAFQLAGFLYLGAALGVSGTVVRRGAGRPPWRMSAPNQRHLLGAVFFGGILGPVLLLLGLKLASAASVSMWLNLEMVATAVLGRLFFHDQLGRFGWLGVAGVLLAGALLSAGDGMAGVWAGLLVAGACTCWGLDNHFTALIDGISPSQSTFWKGLVAGVINLVIGVAVQPFTASAMIILGALSVGVLAYGVSIALYISSAQGMGATRAQMFFASAPFFGVALSALLLSESISGLQIGAATILILSLFALFRDSHHHVHVHERMSHTHSHRHDDEHHDLGHHDPTHPALSSSHRHAHWHDHEPKKHAHPHWPDLHHRHEHD